MSRFLALFLCLFTTTLLFAANTYSESSLSLANMSAVKFNHGTSTITTKDGKTHLFNVEIASERDQWMQGLMYRKTLDVNAGMLFLFPKEQVYSMWMKNTHIPLDILFIRKDGTIATIAKNTKPESLASISSSEAVIYALELNAGITEKLGINTGDKMTFDPYAPSGQ